MIGRFEELIALAAQKRDLGVKLALERDVRLVRCEDGRLEIALEPSAAKTLVNDLSRKISQWTGRRWMVVVSADEGEPTVKSQNEARQAELKTGVQRRPAGAGGAGALSRRRDRRRAQGRGGGAQGLPPGDPDEGAPEAAARRRWFRVRRLSGRR